VSIIGLGGTGSIVAQQLAYLGVRSFLLIDPDVVESTNLNRIVGATRSDVGSPKVGVAERMIKRINPDAEVTSSSEDVVRQNTARSVVGTDFFFTCTDSHGSRAVLTQLSYQYFVPGVDLGVRIEVREGKVASVVGRVQMLAPGLACTICTKLLDPEAVRRDLLTEEQRRADPYIVGAREPQPSVISLNTTVSGIAVSMFMAAVTGAPMRARHQIILFDSGTVKPIENTPDPECAVCSPLGVLGRGDSWPLPGRPE
jgi:molybdopterin/thiamine biosynthesis adenylyltransferase